MNRYTREDTLSSWYTEISSPEGSLKRLLSGLNLTDRTKKERDAVAKRMDKFARFSWRGYDMFDNFGMFITNDGRNGLTMYNGPSFSNKYTQPQFERAAGILTGVSFSTQQIKFKVAVYWISIEDYRLLLNFLDPYEINDLQFDYDKQYRYLVKLASLKDSTKIVVGSENGEPRYYTEFDLIWDLQGTPCARAARPFEWNWSQNTWTIDTSAIDYPQEGDLDSPFVVYMPISFGTTAINFELKLKYDHNNVSSELSLLNISLNHLEFTGEATIVYDSESGLAYLQYDDSKKKLLSLCTTHGGYRIVEAFNARKALLPGRLNQPGALSHCSLQIQEYNDGGAEYIDYSGVHIVAYARTNII